MLIAHYGSDGLAAAARKSSCLWSLTGDALSRQQNNKKNRNLPVSLQKAANKSIFACVLLVRLLLGHLLIISPHSITADISMLILRRSSSALCSSHAAFSPSRSAGFLYHIFLFCSVAACSYLSQGIYFSHHHPPPHHHHHPMPLSEA